MLLEIAASRLVRRRTGITGSQLGFRQDVENLVFGNDGHFSGRRTVEGQVEIATCAIATVDCTSRGSFAATIMSNMVPVWMMYPSRSMTVNWYQGFWLVLLSKRKPAPTLALQGSLAGRNDIGRIVDGGLGQVVQVPCAQGRGRSGPRGEVSTVNQIVRARASGWKA